MSSSWAVTENREIAGLLQTSGVFESSILTLYTWLRPVEDRKRSHEEKMDACA